MEVSYKIIALSLNYMTQKGIPIIIKGKSFYIEYSQNDNFHILGLNNRPFQAIGNNHKNVEYRTNTKNSPFNFEAIKIGDVIRFINEEDGECLEVKVVRISHYNTSKELFENEGLRNSSSKPKNIKEAINSLESHTGYKEGIKQFGIWAIGFEVIDKKLQETKSEII
jgi:ASC-1-like (ASCH) protein